MSFPILLFTWSINLWLLLGLQIIFLVSIKQSLGFTKRERKPEENPMNTPTHLQLCLRSRGRPSPPSEGDRDQRWSDLRCVAFSLLSFLFIFSLVFILAPRLGSSEPPPPPPLYSTTFRSTPQSPNLVLHEGDLTESLGGSSLLQIPSLLSARFDLFGGR